MEQAVSRQTRRQTRRQIRIPTLLDWVRSGVGLLLVLLLWLSSPLPSSAEEGSSVKAMSEGEAVFSGRGLDADDISTEKISQFIHAYLQVLSLIDQRENELQGAETESESQQIQQDIETEALRLIQASGLTIQEYLQLLSLTNIDPEFGERVAMQLQEAVNE